MIIPKGQVLWSTKLTVLTVSLWPWKKGLFSSDFSVDVERTKNQYTVKQYSDAHKARMI